MELPLIVQVPARADRVAAVEAALNGSAGALWRRELGRWTTGVIPVDALVPATYRHWRPLVRDAMRFVVRKLPAARLAPKIVEQLELPPDLPAEVRLLKLIERVPGLQKIGQTIARNPHLDPRFRAALAQLENGISDVTADQVREIILLELGPRIQKYRVRIAASIFSEASVSAVVRFSWWNAAAGRRERGVFKVLKPHIPDCFAEDMAILQGLARFLARKHRQHRSRFGGLAETLTEVRLLLEHEVDFRREQATIRDGLGDYRSLPGVRVPRLIEPLCTDTITALAEESGVKITAAAPRLPRMRARLAERLAESLVAVPALGRGADTVFHADPHAGNLLYDRRRDEIVLLDWALGDRLAREHRRHLTMLVLMLALRDRDGILRAIRGLTAPGGPDHRATVTRFIDALPPLGVPGAMDAMRLLDAVAREGARFPAPLVMFRKAVFTLEGVVEDVAGGPVRIDAVLRRYATAHWAAATAAVLSVLSVSDWLALQWSAATIAPRLWLCFTRYAEARGSRDRARADDPGPGVVGLALAD